jgi:HK97 family phage major capsid protein
MTEQTTEMQGLLTEIRTGWGTVSTLPGEFKTLRESSDRLSTDLKDVRRQLASRFTMPGRRRHGAVSDECARHLASTFIMHCERSDKLDALCSLPAQRDALMAFARDTLNVDTRTALTTSDIPLPVHYSGEIRELISEFGVVRRCMSPYPIGLGTAKPARMGTRPAFGSIAMSAAFGEKSPTVTFASLESHKIGGIVRLPREIDEQSIVAMASSTCRLEAMIL